MIVNQLFSFIAQPLYTDNQVRRLYGAPSMLGLLPRRVIYTIDQQGIVRHILYSQFSFNKHVEESLRALQQLENS